MSLFKVDLGAAQLDPETKALRVQAKGPPVDEDGTAPDYGLIPVMVALGLVAMPWPENDDGCAEGVCTDEAGFSGALLGARDVRCADVVGKLEPGDVCLHAINPRPKAQIQLKGKKRKVALLTEDEAGETLMLVLDGSKKKGTFKLAVGGCMLQAVDGVWSLIAADGSTLNVGNGEVRVMGAKFGAGVVTPGMTIMQGPIAGSPPGPAAAPLMPATGIYI